MSGFNPRLMRQAEDASRANRQKTTRAVAAAANSSVKNSRLAQLPPEMLTNILSKLYNTDMAARFYQQSQAYTGKF
jgi:hypothetical protein